GRLFREFGAVLAVAVAISSFVSLSLVPAAASRLREEKTRNRFRTFVVATGVRLRSAYERTLAFTLDHPSIPVVAALVLASGAVPLFQTLDQELMPPEDRGLIQVHSAGPDGVGIGYMERQTQKVEEILQPLIDSGEAKSLFTVVGSWDPNRSRVSVPLADWDERERSQQEIIESLEGPLSQIPGARVSLPSSNSLNLRRSGGELEIAL